MKNAAKVWQRCLRAQLERKPDNFRIMKEIHYPHLKKEIIMTARMTMPAMVNALIINQ